jgi:hypothetical protein
VIGLQSRASRDTRSAPLGGQRAFRDYSPEHNPGQEKKLRHGCFSGHDFSP